jgi:glycosyltransferase involved in cell wall biosynthesis
MKKSIGLRKKIFEFLISKCDYVTFVSRNLMEDMEKILEIKSKKRVIHAGVFIEEKDEEVTRNFVNKYGLKGCFPILSFIGPLSWKMKIEGVKRLIEAFGAVKKIYSNSKLLIVGDGRYRIELEIFAEKNKLTDEVIFTGFLENSSIPLSITDIYTHISLQEGFPIALLEAMSMGKPIIAAKTGGIPEIISDGDNGILVGPEPNEIADKIINLSRNNKRMKILGKNAQKTVLERYNWDDIAQKFINLYEGK